MYGRESMEKLNEEGIVKAMRNNQESGFCNLEKYFGQYFRKTVDNFFVYNPLYSDDCINLAYKKMVEAICLLEYKREECGLAVFVNAAIRNEVLHVLQEEYYVNLQFKSDIAKQYCIDRQSKKAVIYDRVRLNNELENYNKKTLSFFIHRFFFLKDKEQVKKEMRIRERESFINYLKKSKTIFLTLKAIW